MRHRAATTAALLLLACLAPAARAQAEGAQEGVEMLGGMGDDMLRFFTGGGGGGGSGDPLLDLMLSGDLNSALDTMAANPLAAMATSILPTTAQAGTAPEARLLGTLLGGAGSPLGGLLGGASGSPLGTFMSSLLAGAGAGGSTAPPTPSPETLALLAKLQTALDGLHSMSQLPHYQDIFTASGFNLTELLNDDYPLIDKLYDVGQALEMKHCTEGHMRPSQPVPTACTGAEYTLSVQGGQCAFYPNGTVACRPPAVVLVRVPPACAYKHSTPTAIVGKECKIVKKYGNSTAGIVGGQPPKVTTFDISHGWDAVPALRQQPAAGADLQGGKPLLAKLQERLQQLHPGGAGSGSLIGEGGLLSKLRAASQSHSPSSGPGGFLAGLQRAAAAAAAAAAPQQARQGAAEGGASTGQGSPSVQELVQRMQEWVHAHRRP